MRLTIFAGLLFVLGMVIGCADVSQPDGVDRPDVSQDTQEVDLEDDPFAIGATLRRIEELGVPTPALIDELEASAYALLESEGCDVAIDAFEEFGRQANWLANLISGGLEPFYRASVSDQRELPVVRIGMLADYERMANDLKVRRNAAMIAQGECLLELDEKGEGTALLLNVLRLTRVSDEEEWDRARNALYDVLEVVDSES